MFTDLTKMIPDTLTDNGAPSYTTTLDARLDLFVKTTREVGVLPAGQAVVKKEPDVDISTSDDDESQTVVSNDDLYAMIDKSWSIDPLDTMKILFNWRDCRGGKGDHRGFIAAMIHVNAKYGDWFITNFKVIPEYGSWLDLVKLWHFVGAESKEVIMAYIYIKLSEDMDHLHSDNPKESAKVSLLAKWLPSENSKWDRYTGDKKQRFVMNLAKTMMSSTGYVKGEHIKRLRTLYVSPLRKHLQLVESKLCAKEFDKIKYETVPSVAMKKYRKAFARNDADGFTEYLQQVQKGEKKINASQVYPHDLVRHYMHNPITTVDLVIEEQWKSIKKTVKETGAFDDSICVCDVSGSMAGTPLEVAIALGLLGLYDDQVITFSESPALHKVPEGSLMSQVQNLERMQWGMSTNFEKTMDLVLDLCVKKKSHPIKRIFIFSDMQFDMAVQTTGNKTHFQLVNQKFAKEEIPVPQIVFWNLNGSTKDFPVTTDENGVVILSGYSPALLSSLVDGADISPMTMLLKVIRGTRYDMIKPPPPSTESAAHSPI